MKSLKINFVKRTLKKLEGKPCWYVSCGRNVGSSFKLALGKKIKRKKPINNEMHPKFFRENDPEYGLLVWCAWRLSRRGKIIVTSDQCADNSEDSIKRREKIRKIEGSRILKVQIINSFNDLKIVLSKGWQLDIFCDRGNMELTDIPEGGEGSNWDLFVPGDFLFGG